MIPTFVGFTLAVVFLSLLFVAYCRLLLARASEISLSETVLKEILRCESVSCQDFDRLQALVRLCPLVQKRGASLAAISVYHVLLTVLYAVSSRICDSVANWTEREGRLCSHFAAVSLDRRIANSRKLWAEQMIHPEK